MLVALRAEHTPTVGLPISGRVRSNVTITEPDGTTTKINEPGPQLSADDDAALIALVVSYARRAEWVVLAGSLPPGLSDDFYVRVVQAIRAASDSALPRIAVDSSGAPMQALIQSGVGVDLIKPNSEELAELTDLPDTFESDPDAAAAAALSLISKGCRAVLATLGSRGALLVTADETWRATMPPVTAKSTVGAGDASLAGYLLADERGAAPERRLAQAVAHGAAAASLPGSTMPTTDQTDPDSAEVHVISRPGSH
jgi:1-phosphofructokinase